MEISIKATYMKIEGMPCQEENEKMDKKKERNRSKVLNTLEPGWIAPDGGWGWMIVIATGFTYVFSLGFIMCFGLIFREHFLELEINTLQTTLLLNIHTSLASFIGLANGPLFRKFSYRQVACVGGLISAVSIVYLSFMNTFYGLLILFSIIQAIGKSLSMSASTFALMSYFTKKRPVAVGLSWTCNSIGAIILPQLTAILMPIYGNGIVLLFGGMAFNNIVCALLLQPVAMHAKRDTENTENQSIETTSKDENITEHDESTSTVVRDELGKTSSEQSTGDDDKNHENKGHGNLDNSDNTEDLIRNDSMVTLQELEKVSESHRGEQNKPPCYTRAFQLVAVFFDLDLLQDCVYVNLIIGTSLAGFAELNFILLIPYILLDYGLRDIEVANIMSVIAGVDIFTRLVISCIATRITCNSRIYFLIGVGLLTLSRIGFAHQMTYGVLMAIAILIGVGKSLTLIFSCLVIPDHVSLEKLPGANGLQMVTKGIIFLALGPLVGWIRDTCGNYTIMLHSLNALGYFVIISWILEVWCCSWKRQRLEGMKENRA